MRVRMTHTSLAIDYYLLFRRNSLELSINKSNDSHHHRIHTKGWQNQTKLKLLVTMNIQLSQSRFDVLFAFYHDSFHLTVCMWLNVAMFVFIIWFFRFVIGRKNTDYGDCIPKWFQNNFFPSRLLAIDLITRPLIIIQVAAIALHFDLFVSVYPCVCVCVFESLWLGNAARTRVLWLAEWFS